jgi:hypothetical protein
MPPSYATSRLVAAAWIASIPDLTASGVGNQLPANESTWAQGGYVVVPATVGGTPHMYAPLRRPVCQVECWATVLNSATLPWAMAADLCEQIYRATLDRHTFGGLLTITDDGVPYPDAMVRAATVLTEPHQMWSDVGDYAGWSFDLQLQWIQQNEVIQ